MSGRRRRKKGGKGAVTRRRRKRSLRCKYKITGRRRSKDTLCLPKAGRVVVTAVFSYTLLVNDYATSLNMKKKV